MSEGRIFWAGDRSAEALRPGVHQVQLRSIQEAGGQLNGDGRIIGNEVREVKVHVCRREQGGRQCSHAGTC